MNILKTLFVISILLISGCAGVGEVSRSETELQSEVGSLRRSVENIDFKLNELNNKILLLHEKIEINRDEERRRRLRGLKEGPPKSLKVVKLTGEAGVKGAKEAADKAASLKKGSVKKKSVKKLVKKKDKRAVVNKSTAKKAAPKKAEVKKAAPKKAEVKKAAPKKAEVKKAAPKKAEVKKAAPKKAEVKKAGPDKVASKVIKKSEKGAPPFPTVDFKGEDEPSETYSKGQDYFMGGRYREARYVFEQVVGRYPDHDLADNSLYWIGESYYTEYNFEDAIKAFSGVVDDYPKGNKAPAALLKVGYSYLELAELNAKDEEAKEGYLAGAGGALRKVVDLFPETSVSEMAKKTLKKHGLRSN